MNIIEAVKETLTNYEKISEFTNNISVDFMENTPTNFGLYSTGDELIREDVLGNQTRRHTFILYANKQSFTDFDRLCNSSFLLELNYWLEKQKGLLISVEIDGKTKTGEIVKLSSANGMMYSIPTGDINGGITYQLQIYAEYSVKEE